MSIVPEYQKEDEVDISDTTPGKIESTTLQTSTTPGIIVSSTTPIPTYPDKQRFDCMPEGNANKEDCIARG